MAVASVAPPARCWAGGEAAETDTQRAGQSHSAKVSESSCSFPPGVNPTTFLSLPFFGGSLWRENSLLPLPESEKNLCQLKGSVGLA